MTIQEAMKQATVELMSEKGFTEIMEINEHDCFNWAYKVFNLLPGSAIGGHRIDGEGQSYIIYQGLCYDAETPGGVACWWHLMSFHRMLYPAFTMVRTKNESLQV